VAEVHLQLVMNLKRRMMLKANARILGILTVVLLVWVIGVWKSCNDGQDVKQVNSLQQIGGDSVRYWRDLYGQEHATTRVQQGELEVLKVLHRGAIDSVCRQLKIKERQLMDMQRVLAKASGRVVTDVRLVPIDTDGGDTTIVGYERFFEYRDSWMSLDGYVNDDSAVVDYTVVVPIEVSTYWKRRWWLGKKRIFINGTSKNPNVSIVGLEGLRVK
jgi:hypothetical protein